MGQRILLLPGDGIGPEIVAAGRRVIEALRDRYGLACELETAPIGGAGYAAAGEPLPAQTLERARAADGVLLGAVGGPQYDDLPREVRPERGLLAIRAELGLFGNLRPAILYPQLADASALRYEVVSGLDLLIVRELTGGIYFGEPRGVRQLPNGERQGYDTEIYSETEIERIARLAFNAAAQRQGRVCSVDKANVLESSGLWREVVERVGAAFPAVELTHMYVDNAAMQLVRAPKQFDVIVTGNMFGDILSDCAAQLTGSIGMLPSASLDEYGKGLYEPVHGSAPDIAGQDKANPLATILSVEMLLRYSLNAAEYAERIERAVGQVLEDGLRTADLHGGSKVVGTQEMGEAVVARL